MKLRVRINKQTSRVELEGESPTVTELNIKIREILLPSHGLSPDTEMTLSLNGSEPLSDTGQTLSSCGIVSGDLVCVILPPSVDVPPPAAAATPLNPSWSRWGDEAVRPVAQHFSKANPSGEEEPQQEVVREEYQDEEEESGWVWEPMLCEEAEEGKVPHSLELLHHQAGCCSTCDTLIVAVHLLMVETGFKPQGSEGRSGEMPPGWRAPGGVYRLQYSHPLCDNSLAMVLAVPMGAVLVINATLKMNQQVDTVRKLSLKPSAYVTDRWTGVVLEGTGTHQAQVYPLTVTTSTLLTILQQKRQTVESAAEVYTDLKKLSRVFKDQLVFPLIATAREAMALPPVFGLPVLPPELLLRVLRLLNVSSLLALSSVNRPLNQATADPALWRHLYHRDFRDSRDLSTSRETNWRELYKKKYKWRKEAGQYPRHKSRYQTFIPPLYPLRPLPNNPIPLYPPGIIGGEYDQRPGILPDCLPRPRYDPIGPLPGHDPTAAGLIGRRGLRPAGNRPFDIRRGFI